MALNPANQPAYNDGVVELLAKLNRNIIDLDADVGGGAASTFASLSDVIVAAAGTAVQLSAQTASRGVFITAKVGNTGNVYIGDSGVTKNSGSKRGITLVQGGSVFIPVNNSNLLWVNADNNNDGIGVNVV